VEPLTAAECFVPGYDAACTLYPRCGLIGALQAAQSNFLATLDACSIGGVMVPKRPGILPKKSGRGAPIGPTDAGSVARRPGTDEMLSNVRILSADQVHPRERGDAEWRPVSFCAGCPRKWA